MSFIQNLFTSRDNNANSATYVGQQDRLWWDPVTNQFYYSDGNTPGGFPVGGGNAVTNQLVNGVYQFVLDSSGNITAPGAISAVGNITAGYFIGNGSQLSSITGANVTGQVSNALVATLAVVAGTVSANAQPNITSLGTLTSVSVSGNADAGNFNTAGQVSATGNISGNYFVGNGSQLTGLYSNTNVSAYLASGSLTANIITSANIAGNYFLGNGAFLTGITANSNYSNANVAAFLPTYTGNLVALTGDVTTTANVSGGNLRTAGQVTATGNVTGGNVRTAGQVSAGGNITTTANIAGNYFLGNGAFLTGITANSNYSNANVAAYLASGTLGSNIITTANVSGGNLRTTGQVSAVGNITGNYFIGNGSQLTSITGANVTGTVANATHALVADSANSVSGANVIGQVANALVAGTVYTAAQPNITSVGALTSVTVVGNTTTGNLATAGNINGANLNISNGAKISGKTSFGFLGQANINAFGVFETSATVSAAGNVTGGNILTEGQVSATGNVTGNYILGNGSQLTGINATTNKIFNGNSYANVATPNGNVVVGANGQLWTFGTSGNLTLPSNTSSINYANGSPYGGGAGNITAGNVRIQDENVTLTNAVNTINFAGNGVIATNVGNLVTVTISGAPTNIPVQTGNAGLVLMTDGGNLYWNGALGASYEIDGAYANAFAPGAFLDAGAANADYTGETQVYGGAADSDYSLTLSGVALTGQYEDLLDAPNETTVPLTTTSYGFRGQMAFDANWLYVCIADNQWRRASLGSW